MMNHLLVLVPWVIPRGQVVARLDAGYSIGALASGTAAWPGRLAFAGVFALLIVWLLVVPESLVVEGKSSTAWWRNVRTWAIVIAASQLLLYLLWA